MLSLFCDLFNYQKNPSFLIALWLPISNACTRISKVSWKLFLNIPENSICIHDNHFGILNGTKNFQKAHFTTWSDVISFSPLAAPSLNTVIKSRHVIIFRDPYQSRMSPGYQKSRNTTSNGVSDSIV